MLNSTIGQQTAKIHSKQPWFVLSAAQDFSLLTSENSAISHFYGFETDQSADTFFAIPDGCVDIFLDCDATQPEARICGSTLEARKIDLISNHRYFGVRFRPGVIPDFINLSAKEILDKEYNFLDVVTDGEALIEQLITQSSFNQKVSAFSQFLADKQVRKPSEMTSMAVKEICQHQGNIRVNDLESITGCTTRTIQRQFQDDVGMSPKVFSRMIRCQSAVYGINHNQKVAFSDLAYNLGFSDQSHFLREFKKLVSTTPADYQNRVRQDTYLNRIRCT